MTKEELEKEVTEYLNIQTLPKIDSLVYRVIKNLIFGFAEPREKQIAELEAQIEKVKHYLDYDIPHDLINEATTKIWRMLK